MDNNEVHGQGIPADLQASAIGKAAGASRLRLQRTVIRTLSGAELQIVAGGVCGGASVQPPSDTTPPPPTGTTKCAGTIAKG